MNEEQIFKNTNAFHHYNNTARIIELECRVAAIGKIISGDEESHSKYIEEYKRILSANKDYEYNKTRAEDLKALMDL